MRLTVDNRTGAEVLEEQVCVESCTGQDQLQWGDLLQHISHLSEQEVSEAVTLVHLVLGEHRGFYPGVLTRSISWSELPSSLDAHHNNMSDSCQTGVSWHQRPEEHSTGAKGEQRLWRDPEEINRDRETSVYPQHDSHLSHVQVQCFVKPTPDPK